MKLLTGPTGWRLDPSTLDAIYYNRGCRGMVISGCLLYQKPDPFDGDRLRGVRKQLLGFDP